MSFPALQQRLHDAGPSSFAALGDPEPWTVIGLPSHDFGPAYAQRHDVPALEHRWLHLLLLLRRPRLRVAVVTAVAVPDDVVEYYLELAGVPDGRDRLKLLSLEDASSAPLAHKLLRRPSRIAELRAWAGQGPRLVLPFDGLGAAVKSTAVALDAPLWAVDHRFAELAGKSGNRRLLRDAGVAVPAGREDIRSEPDLEAAITALDVPRVVVKLDRGVTGDGNVVLDRADGPPAALVAALPGAYRTALRCGAVVEELVPFARSPSAQARILRRGVVEVAATHDQLLRGHAYAGCRVPAADQDAAAVAAATARVAEHLAGLGATGRIGVDFVIGPDGPVAVEVNLREGATTHPVSTALALAGPDRHVRATDGLRPPEPRGVSWAAFAAATADLRYDARRREGIVCFMQRSLEREGRLSVVAIGADASSCDALMASAQERLTEAAGLTAVGS